jgi:ATP-dependent Lon protease
VEEKIEIAKRHLIPKQLAANGLKKSDVRFDRKAIEHVAEFYTRESGVRQLDKQFAKIMRVIARHLAFGKDYKKTISVSDIGEILGPPQYLRDRFENNEFAGDCRGR